MRLERGGGVDGVWGWQWMSEDIGEGWVGGGGRGSVG